MRANPHPVSRFPVHPGAARGAGRRAARLARFGPFIGISAALAFLLVGVDRAKPLNASPPSGRLPNILFITIDTLRADHLGCYGDSRLETPFIDRLARSSARFARAYSPVPITLPAHTAIFTGSYPVATGMHDFSGNRLGGNVPTLARVLQENGYRTAAFIGAAVLDSRFGLNQGFETYFDHFNISGLDEANLDLTERRGDLVADEALDWLKRLSAERPYFLWVHLYDPHFPYNPPEPYATRYRGHPYDGEIAFADAQVGRLIGALEERNDLQDALIVLAGDHGEGLNEHGERTHGFFIYNSTLHVPLIIKVPGAAPRVVNDDVSLVDVMPTVLQAAKVPIPASVQGRSLLSLVVGARAAAGSSEICSETFLPMLHFRWSQLRAIQWQGWKYIDAPRPELYDLQNDPHELRNLYPVRQALGHELHDRLFGALRRFTVTAGPAGEKELTDPALLERLRSLGYVAISAGTYAEQGGKPLPDPKDRIRVYELFSDAMSDGQHGRFADSLSKLREAEKVEPASLPIRYLKALDFYRLKQFASARDEFKAAIELDPKFALATYYLGLAQVELGDLEGAETSFNRALALDPTNFSAAYNLGAVELKKDRVEEALAHFQRATEINPDYAQAHEALGELYLYLKRPADAARALERAVDIAPGFGKAHYNLARAYQALGRGADAERQFRLAQRR